jgi:cell division protein FtsQ
LFVDKSDILKVLVATTHGAIKGQARSSFDLRKLEQVLEDNVWVRDAELYFDNKDVLHINISEREPVARVFNTANKSFYVDQDEKRMPLSDKMSARVPVFTGFPASVGSSATGGAAGPARTGKDSVLLHELRLMAEYINRDSFWTAQVAQININEQREFEMIPLVGNHIVKLGDGENMAEKFHRLYVFLSGRIEQNGF